MNNSIPIRGLEDKNLVVNDLPVNNDYLFIVERKLILTWPDTLMRSIIRKNLNQGIVKWCKFNSCSIKSVIGSDGVVMSIN